MKDRISFDKTIDRIQNINNNESITANELVNLFSRLLEDLEHQGVNISELKISDEKAFAIGISYLVRELSETIRNNKSVFDGIPNRIKKNLDENNKEIIRVGDELTKLKKKYEELDGSNVEVEEARSDLKSVENQIEELNHVQEELNTIREDIKIKNQVRDELIANADNSQAQIDEYKNSLTVVNNAWETIESREDISELIRVDNKTEIIKDGFTSFEELRQWFSDIYVVLQNGMDAYIKAYKSILEVIG